MKIALAYLALCLLATSAFAHQYVCDGAPDTDLTARVTFTKNYGFAGGYIFFQNKFYEIITLGQQTVKPNDAKATIEDWNVSGDKGFDASFALEDNGSVNLAARHPVKGAGGLEVPGVRKGTSAFWAPVKTAGVPTPAMDMQNLKCRYSEEEVEYVYPADK